MTGIRASLERCQGSFPAVARGDAALVHVIEQPSGRRILEEAGTDRKKPAERGMDRKSGLA